MSSLMRRRFLQISQLNWRGSKHFVIPNQRDFASQSERCILELKNDRLHLKSSSWSKHLEFNHLWLRDHCRCSKCYNYSTNQRKLDLLSIPSDIKPIDCRVDPKNLYVSWSDNHSSEYPVDWLWNSSYDTQIHNQPKTKPVLWNGSNISSHVTRVAKSDFLNSEAGLEYVIKSLVEYGVGIVDNVPASIKATEEVVRRIAHVQHTLFGGMWEFSNEMAHSDTAYTSEALGAHNDNTYFNEAAGLQVFHCLQHDGAGGENLLVDGFNAAQNLLAKSPAHFELLASTPIESEYIESGQHFSSINTVLRRNALSGALEQIRFNLYDRAPMRTVPSSIIPEFYKALISLAKVVREPQGEWWLKLQPGMVIFIDNWRVLHGRASYTGFRKMGGCYVNRSDFLSKAKVLGVM